MLIALINNKKAKKLKVHKEQRIMAAALGFRNCQSISRSFSGLCLNNTLRSTGWLNRQLTLKGVSWNHI